MCALESAETAGPMFKRGLWFSRYALRKLGLTAWITSLLTRNEFAYVRLNAPFILLSANSSTIRSMTLGRKLPRAPCRSKEPTSSSSNRATTRICEESESEEAELSRAWTAAQEQSLSSMRPAKINSLSRPPRWAGWMSNSSSSQLTIVESDELAYRVPQVV